MADDLAAAAGLVLSAVALLGVAAFFSLWVHRAPGNRALTMGLYIVFGAFGFFLFLFGLGSAWRSYQEGQPVEGTSWLWIAIGVIAGLGLIPPCRQLLARVLPIDPQSWTDVIGFIVIAQFAALSIYTLLQDDTEATDDFSLGFLAIQAFALIALAFIAVGIGFVRTPRQAIERLGLRVPTAREVAIAIGMVFAAFAVAVSFGALAQWLQPDLSAEIDESVSEITGSVHNVLGAVLLGLLSGTSEEILFRGAIQPKYGVVFAALVFAVVHAQYGVSFVTLGVFVVGVLFGLQRKYFGTTSAIITHAAYNTIVVLISLSQ